MESWHRVSQETQGICRGTETRTTHPPRAQFQTGKTAQREVQNEESGRRSKFIATHVMQIMGGARLFLLRAQGGGQGAGHVGGADISHGRTFDECMYYNWERGQLGGQGQGTGAAAPPAPFPPMMKLYANMLAGPSSVRGMLVGRGDNDLRTVAHHRCTRHMCARGMLPRVMIRRQLNNRGWRWISSTLPEFCAYLFMRVNGYLDLVSWMRVELGWYGINSNVSSMYFIRSLRFRFNIIMIFPMNSRLRAIVHASCRNGNHCFDRDNSYCRTSHYIALSHLS